MRLNYFFIIAEIRIRIKFVFLFLFLINQSTELVAQNNSFTITPASGCASFTTILSANSLDADSCVWDFGNGNVGRGISVAAAYNVPGDFTVKLTAYKNGQPAVYTKVVKVFAAPKVDFSFDKDLGCTPLTVNFKDMTVKGDAGIKTWLWDFGNGRSAQVQNPSVTYITPTQRDVTLVVEDSNGCRVNIVKKAAITIVKAPIASFDFLNNNSCTIPFTTEFVNKSEGASTLTYLWSFGDGGTSTQVNPQHTYTQIGQFPVRLEVTDELGCKDDTIVQGRVYSEDFKATVTLTETEACGSLVTKYSATYSNPVGSFKWTFDPGLTVDQSSGTITANTVGTYKIRLDAVSRNGCATFVERTITVNPVPVVDFDAAPLISCSVPATVNFNNKTKDGDTYAWSFVGASSTTDRDPQVVFNSYGTFNVLLVATSDKGCVGEMRKNGYITVSKPVLQLSATDDDNGGCAPFTTNFKVEQTGGYGTIGNIQWNFGNGNTFNGLNPPAQTYSSVGTYTVTAVVSFSTGCPNQTLTKTIKVGNEPNFTATLSSLNLCPITPLKGQASPASGGNTYVWKIGNDTSINGAALNYKFKAAGTYPVTITGISQGCSKTLNLGNVVVKPSAASFRVGTLCNGLSVDFTNTSPSGVQSTWNFGDGTTLNSDSREVKHIFPAYGNYRVRLTTSDPATGCSDTISQVVEVRDRKISYVLPETKGCAPLSVSYTTTLSNPTHYWLVADTVIGGRFLNMVFDQPGAYDLSLVSISSVGCRDTFNFKGLIKAVKPEAGFEFDPIGGCAPITINFKDSTKAPLSPVKTYQWDIGGFASSTSTQFSYNFLLTDTVPVTLYVEDVLGCKDTVTHDIFIAYPKVDVVIPVESFCTGNPFKPVNNSTGVGLKYYWDFGDGSPVVNDTNPGHYYANEGVYTIKLRIQDANNCEDSIEIKDAITIKDFQYDFDAYPRAKNCPELLTNFAISPPDILYRNTTWDFGNGAVSDDTSRFPTNLYLQAGIYDVTLILEDYRGCIDTIRKEDFIDISGPSGEFNVSVLSGCVPLDVLITADVKNSVANFWDFGDGMGRYDTVQHSVTPHTYQESGVYRPSVVIDDGLGCMVTVNGPEVRVGKVTSEIDVSSGIVCSGENLLFTDVTPNQPHSPNISRLWNMGDGMTRTDSTFSYTYNTNDSTDYWVTLTVADSLGCSDADSFLVRAFKNAPLSVTDAFTICKGDEITLTASGVHSYEWARSGSLVGNNTANPVASPLQTTTYYVRGFVSPTCYTDDTVLVRVIERFPADAGPDTIICIGQQVQLFINTDSVINSGEYKYQWSYNGTFIDSLPPLVSPAENAVYVVNVKNGSCYETNIPVFVEVRNHPQLIVGGDQRIFPGQEVRLEAQSDQPVVYTWSPSNGLSCTDCPYPVAKPAATTIYSVTVTDQYGCETTEDITVAIIEGCDGQLIQIPNAFTPNNDGRNDLFTIRNNDFIRLSRMNIYSRTGELIYQTSDINDGWDGTYGGVMLNAGVYVYYIDAVCSNGQPIMLKGNITLLR